MHADIIQTLRGAISSLAFAILFGVRNRKALISIVIGSAIGWAAYIRLSARRLRKNLRHAGLWADDRGVE